MGFDILPFQPDQVNVHNPATKANLTNCSSIGFSSLIDWTIENLCLYYTAASKIKFRSLLSEFTLRLCAYVLYHKRTQAEILGIVSTVF